MRSGFLGSLDKGLAFKLIPDCGIAVHSPGWYLVDQVTGYEFIFIWIAPADISKGVIRA